MMKNQKQKKSNRRKNAAAKPAKQVSTSRVVSRTPAPTRAPAASHKAHVRASCSITDPFCVHARAARRPDGAGLTSIPYQVKSTVTLTTGAAGTSGGRVKFVFVPGGGIFGYAGCAFDATNATLGAAWTPWSTTGFVSTNAEEVRIVSYGIKILSITSATTSQGYVIIGNVSTMRPGTVTPIGTTNYPEVSVRTLAPGMESTWVSKPTGSNAHNFRPVSTYSDVTTDFDWSGVSIEVAGGPLSTPVLLCEIFCNVEVTLKTTQGTTDGLSQLIPPATPANNLAVGTQRSLHSAMPAIFDAPVASVSARIEKMASTFVEDALTGAMAFLGL